MLIITTGQNESHADTIFSFRQSNEPGSQGAVYFCAGWLIAWVEHCNKPRFPQQQGMGGAAAMQLFMARAMKGTKAGKYNLKKAPKDGWELLKKVHVDSLSGLRNNFIKVQRYFRLRSLQKKYDARTMTKPEWELYRRQLKLAGKPLPEGGTGSGFAQNARFGRAYDFYKSSGFTSSRIMNHLRGIDFAHSVEVVQLKPGLYFTQHVANGRIGNYFSFVGTPASKLGINPSGRIPYLFKLTRPQMALRSTAASGIVDTWTVPSKPFATTGGGTQFFVLDNTFFIPIKKSP